MKALTNMELSSFCSQLALILKAGISSTEGLSLLLEDTEDEEGRKILSSLLDETENGSMLSEAMKSCQVFPAYLCSMTEIGETSGRLDEVMAALGEHYRREDNLARNIRSSISYPLVMLGMMIVIMILLLVKVMPVFQQVFEQLGTELTGISGMILRAGNLLSRYSLVFLLVLFLVAAAFCLVLFTKAGKNRARLFSEHFFATRALSEKIACSRFASGMYLALSSGLDTDQSLEMTERLVEHENIRRKIHKIRELTSEGTGFSEAVTKAGIFTGLYSHMVSVGFRTGSTDEVMKQISLQYDEEIEDRMNSLIARLEPTLVAVLSIAVGMILLSVMLPLMGILSNIGF